MKRGESGLSLLVAVDKPAGMSSHDVVNRARRIFGERRVGHTGTLDPLATGVLPICVGPATRLDQYMTDHDKRYRVTIEFGCETTTDDAEGEPTVSGSPDGWLYDDARAREFLTGYVGPHEQVPPQYSAVKVDGKRAYQLARSGNAVDLEPRRIEVYEASLAQCGIDEQSGRLSWSVDFSVSKGTYIRSLARDIGRAVGCPAHVAALQRRAAGRISIEDCVSIESLENLGVDAALDPVAVLGFRYAFGDDAEKAISSGSALAREDLVLNERLPLDKEQSGCTCMSSVVRSDELPKQGELVSVVVGNRLKALYSYDGPSDAWKPACVFNVGVMRG